MQSIEILCPAKPFIFNAEKLLVPYHDELGVLSRKIQNLRRTRDLLLPRLLSGQVELDKSNGKETNL
jgi:type I restriction enzyme, S subunit